MINKHKVKQLVLVNFSLGKLKEVAVISEPKQVVLLYAS
jgi:hypothetical protein